ncbi:aminoglycoside phosphotransferase (APT) family kinase protein [Sphingobium sp. OAS761]|uniref:phosphotransferase family protein n=1 Tax=Sphingobium sp. OAS761 TaxID=2817901 RepID=UPI00209FACCF|nr:aminoglycoside phosphotransferase family protein [Sphingobium sp. OAS761]MCP1468682.1 aminoglycoside phosphotransferase (APT) family kinase protein [Sphingobium sp. OAS761]
MTMPDPSAFIAAGASAEVYRLEPGVVLKLFHAGIDPGIVTREEDMARIIEATGLPVPRLIRRCAIEGRSGLVYSELAGPNLLAYIGRHPHRAHWALDQMAALQQRISACRIPLRRSRKVVMADDIEAGPIDERLRAAAIDRLEALHEGDGLSHGDLHPGNLIVTDAGVGIVDWSRAAMGTAASDVVRTEMVMRFGPGRGDGTQVGWRESAVRDAAAGWYVHRYRAQSGLDPEALAAWRPLVALAWLRQRAPVRDAAFAAYLNDALRVAGLPPQG